MAEGIIGSVLRWLRAGYPEGVPQKDRFALLALLRRTLSEEDYVTITEQLASEPPPIVLEDIRHVIEQVTSEPPAEEDVRQVAARLAASGWPLDGGVRRLAAEAAQGTAINEGVTEDAAHDGSAAVDSAVTEDATRDGSVAVDSVVTEDAALDSGAEEYAGADGAAQTDQVIEDQPHIVERILAWLRVGYPQGVPTTDYVPVLALLRRRITDDEVAEVAHALLAEAGEGGEVSSTDARVLMSKVLNDVPSETDLARVEAHLVDMGGSLS
ncbi:DUF3349 domain-containing protein [Cumulibacter soli]|uniref:DUF3349 domain-containing protein n=1 Tax=Cumulibacter soli TaxID=2546344 RepID=UPI001ABA1BFF|nr:DUF3349 domain-containing protein [Cumulibacter soli]